MPEELTPVIREEEYLAAIAGQEVTPPDPATRKEEWLDLIADNVASLASDLTTAEGEIDDLQDIVPTPAAADEGKVLTAGADGTASWQTASGGGATRFEVFMDSETLDFTEINAAASEIYAACESGNAVFYFEARNTYYQAILNGWYYDDTTPEYGFLLTTITSNGTIANTFFIAATASAHPTTSSN